jgi:Leucine-rich repeat (LRR) protein
VYLKDLDFSSNKIITLPMNLYQLSELENLDLSNNELQIIPLNFSEAKSLQKLDIRRNPFYKWHLKQIKEKISVKELLLD